MENRRKSIITQLVDNMVKVEGGTFYRGSIIKNEKHIYPVTLNDFCIGKYKVTREEWEAVMDNYISTYRAKDPADHVAWNDCQEFIKKLNDLTGLKFRMPTEAEWEYAARGGNKFQGYKYSDSITIDDLAWYWEELEHQGRPVKSNDPNELGICGLNERVGEWCSDWYKYDYYASAPINNPTGPSTGYNRVIRGGGFQYSMRLSSYPHYYQDDFEGIKAGIASLRLACSL